MRVIRVVLYDSPSPESGQKKPELLGNNQGALGGVQPPGNMALSRNAGS